MCSGRIDSILSLYSWSVRVACQQWFRKLIWYVSLRIKQQNGECMIALRPETISFRYYLRGNFKWILIQYIRRGEDSLLRSSQLERCSIKINVELDVHRTASKVHNLHKSLSSVTRQKGVGQCLYYTLGNMHPPYKSFMCLCNHFSTKALIFHA